MPGTVTGPWDKRYVRHDSFLSVSQSGGRDTQILVNILCYKNKQLTECHRAKEKGLPPRQEEWRKTPIRDT